jgi:hypothetical protein
MHFSKALVLLLVSVQADPRGGSFTTSNERDEINVSLDLDVAHSNPRPLGGEEKLDTYKENSIQHDLPPGTQEGLQQIQPLYPTEINTFKDTAPMKRKLRQNVQRATIEQDVPCVGIRKIVQCKDTVPEEECKAALEQAGVQVVVDIPNTLFFAICVDSEAEAAKVADMTKVGGVENDPPRTLSVVEGSMVKRHLQASQQVTPYGINLVKAPEFWSRYNGNQGAGIKVCVIDTGLRRTHRDIRGGDLSGSNVFLGVESSPVSYHSNGTSYLAIGLEPHSYDHQIHVTY